MRKTSFIIGLFIIVIVIFTGSVSADSPLSVEIESKESSINLNWDDIADKYELYLLDRKGDRDDIWSGEKNSYKHKELESNAPYKYKLYAYDKHGKKVDSVIITSYTLKSEKQINDIQNSDRDIYDDGKLYYPMFNNTITTVSNDKQLTLSWGDIPTENNEYKIYKDGEFLTNVKGTEYIDSDIKQDEIYKYSVVGNKNLPDKEVASREKEATNEIGRKLSAKEKHSLASETKTVSIIVRTSDENVFNEELKYKENKDISSTNDFQPPSGRNVMIRYTTFIPMEYAGNPWCNLLCEYSYFGGDDRVFESDSTKFRTRIDAYSTWNQNFAPEGVTLHPQTGLTTGYDEDKNLIGEDQADAEKDLNIWYEDKGEDWLYHRGSVASSNPLTPSPNIDGFYYAKVWLGGKGEFYGVHDQAPSHEIYIKYGNKTVAIHQAEHLGFDYLFPWTTKNEWEVNVH